MSYRRLVVTLVASAVAIGGSLLPAELAGAQQPQQQRMQLWSNSAALHTEDGKYLSVNVSYECFDATFPAEIVVIATQGNAVADIGTFPAELPCSGKLETWDLAAEVSSPDAAFVIDQPVELSMRLYNGLNELRVLSTQIVGAAGVRHGMDFSLAKVVLGYPDFRLDNKTTFTATIYYQCPAEYPRHGKLRAIQADGKVVGDGRYDLVCDGTNRAAQVEVGVLNPNKMAWTSDPVELINELGNGPSRPQLLWQRFGVLPIAATGELPIFGRPISNLQEDWCIDSREVTLAACGEDEPMLWNALADNTITEVNGRCLDASGSRIRVATCDGSGAQKWTLEPREKNFSIRNGDKCLTPVNAEAGAKLELADCLASGGYQGWWVT